MYLRWCTTRPPILSENDPSKLADDFLVHDISKTRPCIPTNLIGEHERSCSLLLVTQCAPERRVGAYGILWHSVIVTPPTSNRIYTIFPEILPKMIHLLRGVDCSNNNMLVHRSNFPHMNLIAVRRKRRLQHPAARTSPGGRLCVFCSWTCGTNT